MWPAEKKCMSTATEFSVGKSRFRFLAAVTAAIALMIALIVAPSAFASAAPATEAGAMTIEKLINGNEHETVEQQVDQPGAVTVAYTIDVTCADADCVNAQVVDTMPAGIEGFPITGIRVDGVTSSEYEVSTNACGDPASLVATAACEITVDFKKQFTDGNVGLLAGQTAKVTIEVQVPADLAPSWAFNKQGMQNTAVANWDNGVDPSDDKGIAPGSVTDDALLTVIIPTRVGVDVTKTWEPASQQYAPGAESNITLTAKNTSNINVPQLVVHEPAGVADTAAELADSNLFRIVDLSAMNVTLPAGADTVRVDAYVFDENTGTWSWHVGTAADVAELPAGVTAANVGGLRFTFDGDIETGAVAGIGMTVAQRANDRVTDASQAKDGAGVTNVVEGSVVDPADPTKPVTDTAEAPFEIRPLDVVAAASKSFDPASIPAGTTSTAKLGATNASNGTVHTLTLTEEDFFTEDIRFGGFSSITAPAGATGGTVVWRHVDGSVTGPFDLDLPTLPVATNVAGFDLIFTGEIASGAQIRADVIVAPTVEVVTEGTSATVKNTVTATAENAVGKDTKDAEADLKVNSPKVEVDLTKQVRPGGQVLPGGNVVTSLTATSKASDSHVRPTTITIEDVWDVSEENNFWNAFNISSIAPTQVPAGAGFTLSVFANGAWVDVAVEPSRAESWVFSKSAAELSALLAAEGLAPADVEGVRFQFENPAGFASGVSVIPNIAFEARADKRDGSGPTSVANAGKTTYTNVAIAKAHADIEGIPGGISSTTDPVTGDAAIESFTGTGPHDIHVNKRWVEANNKNADISGLESQSGKIVSTRNEWLVATPGFDKVVLTDSASLDGSGNPVSAEETVFQAFNLVALDRNSMDGLLKWDSISQVELFDGSAWVVVPAPSGSWMNGAEFKGYTLTSEERASTTGVRVTVVENTQARLISSDPLRPEPGSGVASSALNQLRPWLLTWELRNVPRVTTSMDWVTGDSDFGSVPGSDEDDNGVVRNTFSAHGTKGNTTTGRTAQDDLILTNAPPLVETTKTVTTSLGRNEISIPESGDIDPATYPTVTYTIDTWNNAVARASYLRMVDPATTDDTNDDVSAADKWGENPFADAEYNADKNPFEKLTITNLTFSTTNAVYDFDASMVWLWMADGTSQSMSVNAVNSLSAAELENVVGIGATYQSTTPETTGGLIPQGAAHGVKLVIDTQVRQYLRSTPTTFVGAGTIDNKTVSQSYDPVMYPTGAASTPFDDASVETPFVNGTLNATASKEISPSTFLEAQGTADFTVKLGGTTQRSTVSASVLTIEDNSEQFWNAVELNAGTPFQQVSAPAGADQLAVSLYIDGTWVAADAAPLAFADGFVDPASIVLPAGVDLATATGVRFEFSRADGAVFSTEYPVPALTFGMTLNVRLLETLRDGSAPVYSQTGTPLQNVVNVTAERADGKYVSRSAGTSSTIKLERGTLNLDVAKHAPNSPAPAGEPLPWTLEFANVGTGYIPLEQVIDNLPQHLEWDFEPATIEITNADPNLTPMVTEPISAELDANGDLVFTWDEGVRMQPGDRVKITVGLSLLPGLAAGQRATNEFRVVSSEELDACTNTILPGRGTLSGLEPNECGSSNFIQPMSGGALISSKRVNGDILNELVDGEKNVRGGTTCPVDTEGFTRQPCASNTIVGGTDEWRLDVMNSGTYPFDTIVIADPLPYIGDRMLATGAPRNSTFAAVFDGEFGIAATDVPEGTVVNRQVTTTFAPCIGETGPSLWPQDRRCDNAATWVNIEDYTGDWAAVTGIRIQLDFAGTAAKTLLPGEAVQLRYRTYNAPASTERPDFAPIDSSVTSAVSWNQMSALATYREGNQERETAAAPIVAGVILQTGALDVRKVIEAEDGEVPTSDTFDFQVACQVAGADVVLPNGGRVTVDEANAYTTRLSGIALGAHCDVSEVGELGTYGEDERVGDNARVRIVVPFTGEGTQETVEIVEITNVYRPDEGDADASTDPDGSASTDPDGSADAGVEGDADSSTDPDADASTDPDGSADAGVEGDASAEAEAEVGANADAAAGSDAEADAGANADAGVEGDVDASTDPDGSASTDPDGSASTDPDGSTDAGAEGDASAAAEAEAGANADAAAGSDAEAAAGSDVNATTNAEGDASAGADAKGNDLVVTGQDTAALNIALMFALALLVGGLATYVNARRSVRRS